jgi:glycerate 2-kinase
VNRGSSGRGDLRELLERAFRAAVAAADPAAILAGSLPEPPLGRIVVVGAGKAAAAMAVAIERHYPEEVALGGLVIAPDDHTPTPVAKTAGRIDVALASHPLPDERGVRATERILAEVAKAEANDLVLVLISGGGSSLLCAPDDLELAEKAALTHQLLRSGAEIAEMNAVRKHLSRVKGGRLALAAAPAPVVALVLSDVVGDDLSSVASGPTVADPSTYSDALAVLDRHRIEHAVARRVLEAGVRGERPETPKPGNGLLDHVENRLVGSNQRSLEAAAGVLSQAGFAAHVLSSTVTGEARVVGAVHAAIARQVLRCSQPFAAPCALISGGETTVTVRGGGRGGRNSEFGLALALDLPPGAPVWALAADTDGIDGSEDNAGVVVSPEFLRRLDRRRASDLLDSNDSYNCFAEAEHLLVTGPTGTNVNDLRLVLVEAAHEFDDGGRDETDLER